MAERIRRMQPADTEPVLQIWLDASLQAHPFIDAAYWRAQVQVIRTSYLSAPQTDHFVYLRDGEVLGFLSVMEGSYIGALFVAPAMQGQGIGAALLAECMRSYSVLTLHVFSENPRALAFYERNGFVRGEETESEFAGHKEWTMYWP